MSRGVCASCKKPVVVNGISAMGQTYHLDHFICTYCQKPIGNSAFFVHPKTGKVYCEADFKDQFCPNCEKCGEELDYFIRALGKAWHLAHFCCAECDQPIGEDAFFERDGKAFCTKDFYKLFGITCSKCQLPISGACIDFMGLKYHPSCHTCGSCQKVITGDSIFAFSKPFHPDCFVCATCSKSFGPSVGYYDFDDKPYCEYHYHQQSKTLCVTCQQPVKTGAISRLGEKVYHAEHFVCSRCQTVIRDSMQYAVLEDEPICSACIEKDFAEDE